MTETSKINKYRPKDIRSPYVGFPILFFVIWFSTKFITQAYSEVPIHIYITFSIIFIIAFFFSTYLVFANIVHCLYIESTDNEITGKNIFKIKRGSLKYSEINEIIITKGVFIICLKDIHGKKLTIIFRKEFIPLLNEIFGKAENCEKININYDYFIKRKVYSEISQIKPILDRRLAEIKDKSKSL